MLGRTLPKLPWPLPTLRLVLVRWRQLLPVAGHADLTTVGGHPETLDDSSLLPWVGADPFVGHFTDCGRSPRNNCNQPSGTCTVLHPLRGILRRLTRMQTRDATKQTPNPHGAK